MAGLQEASGKHVGPQEILVDLPARWPNRATLGNFLRVMSSVTLKPKRKSAGTCAAIASSLARVGKVCEAVSTHTVLKISAYSLRRCRAKRNSVNWPP